MIGRSVKFLRVIKAARMVAATDVCVLLNGKQSTGRRLIAHEIHRLSLRRHAPFRALNCSFLEDFAAALEANGGTLFLGDVGLLKPALQHELLVLLERKTMLDKPVDIRIIASADTTLVDQVRHDEFREDLYYRLNVVLLEVPCLKERAGDIPLLLKAFVKQSAHQYGRQMPTFGTEASNLVKKYAWPGNIRELRNFAERMVILLPGQTIQPNNLPSEMKCQSDSTVNTLFELPKTGIDLNSLEADILRQALMLAGGNYSKAARLLNISRDTLVYRSQKLFVD